jgi:ADP-ribosylation factor-like protein 13B
MVTHPFTEKNDRKDKNKNEQRVKIIDVSGAKKFRHNSWAQFYDQIHGLIFVIDSSEQDRLDENKETLEDLLDNEKLKNKPILM